jgi:hypothetical protein
MCHSSDKCGAVVQEIYAVQVMLKVDWLTNCEGGSYE